MYDLDSVHGTFVNKKRIQSSAYVPLHNGDFVTFGASKRQYFATGGPSEAQRQATAAATATAAAASTTTKVAVNAATTTTATTTTTSSVNVSTDEEGREMFTGNAIGKLFFLKKVFFGVSKVD